MPTSRPRHLITESDELAAALDQGARRWPDLSRAGLLTQLALEGASAIARDEADESARRRRLATRAGAILSGTSARAELAKRRDEDWAE